jgi:hypothetical protein
VQEVVLRFSRYLQGRYLQGFYPCTPQGDTIPLTPSRKGHIFYFSPSEGVQRGLAPLQVQEVVLRFSRYLQGRCLQGFYPCTPQGDTIPLTPFMG